MPRRTSPPSLLGWVRLIAERRGLSVAVVLRGGRDALEWEMASLIWESAQALGTRAADDSDLALDEPTLLHQAARVVKDRILTERHAAMARAQAEAMDEERRWRNALPTGSP